MPVFSPPLQPTQSANSFTGNAGIFFPFAAFFALLLSLAGCSGFVVPPPEVGETPPSSQLLQDKTQVAESESPENELAVVLTVEARALFKQSLFPEAEEKFLQALEAEPNHIPALTGISHLYTYYAPERWQEALEYAELAYNLAPEDASVLSYLTWALQLAHRFEEADKMATAAVTANPESGLAQMAQASAASSLYENELALSHLEKALEIDPFNAAAYAQYSGVLDALHDWPKSKEAATKAIELEPDFHLWKPVLGYLVFYNDGDPAAALDIAAPAMQALPNSPFVISLVVDIAAELNEWDKALEGCRQLVTLDSPETPYPDGYDCLTKISMRMEDFEAAARYQDKTEEVAWDDRLDILSNRVLIHNNSGECDQSRAVAQKWLDARPYSLSAQSLLSMGFMCSNDYEEAIHIRQKIVEKLPMSVYDVYSLAVSYASNGMASKAFEIIKDIEHFALEDPAYYDALFTLNLYWGDVAESVKYAQQWAEMRSCCSAPLESLAFAHLYNGDTQAAQEAAENAYQKGSTSSYVTGILGYTYLIYGEIEAAEQMLLSSFGKNPELSLTRYSLSDLYLSTNRCEESEPHVNWLVDGFADEEQKVALGNALEDCYEYQLTQEVVQD